MTNRILYGNTEPTDLPRRRTAKTCKRCGQWFSIPRSEAHKFSHCSADCTTAPATGNTLDQHIADRRRRDEAFAWSLGFDAATGEVVL